MTRKLNYLFTFEQLVTNLRNARFSSELNSWMICHRERIMGCWSKYPLWYSVCCRKSATSMLSCWEHTCISGNLSCHLPKSVSSPEMTLSIQWVSVMNKLCFNIPLKLWWREYFNPTLGNDRSKAIHECMGLFTGLLIQFVISHSVYVFNFVLVGDRHVLPPLYMMYVSCRHRYKKENMVDTCIFKLVSSNLTKGFFISCKV